MTDNNSSNYENQINSTNQSTDLDPNFDPNEEQSFIRRDNQNIPIHRTTGSYISSETSDDEDNNPSLNDENDTTNDFTSSNESEVQSQSVSSSEDINDENNYSEDDSSEIAYSEADNKTESDETETNHSENQSLSTSENQTTDSSVNTSSSNSENDMPNFIRDVDATNNQDEDVEETKITTENSNKTKDNLFKGRKKLEKNIDDLAISIQNMDRLFDELGDGEISEKLSIRQRNEIVESIRKERDELKDIISKFIDPINDDIKKVSRLGISVTTTTEGFDRLLNQAKETERLSVEDISFQRATD